MKPIVVFFLIIVAVIYSGCYSFTGSSVPPHLKTIGIPLFDDQSGSGEPSLREQLTNKLIDKFRQDNSLGIADKTHSDSVLEGTIVAMPDQPQVIASGETVTKRKITLTVKVVYQDLVKKKKVYEKEFSEWGDYAAGGDLSQRLAAITTAIDKITDDILLATVSNW